MWPFTKKIEPKRERWMFDMDKVRELESLTPEQIVTLVSMAVHMAPDTVVLYSLPDPIRPLVKEAIQ